jgi:hypothetical protein
VAAQAPTSSERCTVSITSAICRFGKASSRLRSSGPSTNSIHTTSRTSRGNTNVNTSSLSTVASRRPSVKNVRSSVTNTTIQAFPNSTARVNATGQSSCASTG